MIKALVLCFVIVITLNYVISDEEAEFFAKLCGGDQTIFKIFTLTLNCSDQVDTKEHRAVREKCFVNQNSPNADITRRHQEGSL